MRLRSAPAVLLAAVLGGCATLSYSPGADTDLSRALVKGGGLDGVIRYRPLGADDFQHTGAAQLDPDLTEAYVVVNTVLSPYARLRRHTVGDSNVPELVPEHVDAYAVLDRRRSWWGGRDRIDPERFDYVLKHENVHFAIQEAGARRINRELRRLLTKRYTDRPYRELGSALAGDVAAVFAREHERIEREHDAFDQDTLFEENTRVLDEWSARTARELRQLEPYAFARDAARNYPGLLDGRVDAVAIVAGGALAAPCENYSLALHSLAGLHCEPPHAAFVGPIDRVALRDDVFSFGLSFEPRGVRAGRWAELVVRVVFPPPGLRPAEDERRASSDVLYYRVQNGQRYTVEYPIIRDWQRRAGPWTFEIYSRGELLARHAFALY